MQVLKDKDVDIIRFFLLLPRTYKLYVLKHLLYFPEQLVAICTYIPSLLENTAQLNFFWQKMIDADMLHNVYLLSEFGDESINFDIITKGRIYVSSISSDHYKVKCRAKHLTDALNKIGLNIRHDSKLCHNWIDGTAEEWWTLDLVVNMCATMRWLYDYTPYRAELRKAIDAETREDAYKLCEPMVKSSILKKHPKPAVWPWMKKKFVTITYQLETSDHDGYCFGTENEYNVEILTKVVTLSSENERFVDDPDAYDWKKLIDEPSIYKSGSGYCYPSLEAANHGLAPGFTHNIS